MAKRVDTTNPPSNILRFPGASSPEIDKPQPWNAFTVFATTCRLIEDEIDDFMTAETRDERLKGLRNIHMIARSICRLSEGF